MILYTLDYKFLFNYRISNYDEVMPY